MTIGAAGDSTSDVLCIQLCLFVPGVGWVSVMSALLLRALVLEL